MTQPLGAHLSANRRALLLALLGASATAMAIRAQTPTPSPSPARYITVFDVRHDNPGYTNAITFGIMWLVLPPLSFIASARRGRPINRKLVVLSMGFGLLVDCLLLSSMLAEQHRLAYALNTGEAYWVEGRVTDFTPGSAEKRALESFEVDDMRFQFDPSAETMAFHKAHGDGGPLREGLAVRIGYWGGDIVRVDTARSTSP